MNQTNSIKEDQVFQGGFDIGNLKPMESQSIDLSEFEGKRFKIEIVEVIEVPSQFSPTGKQKVLRVMSEVITKIQTKESGEKDVRASDLFNLTEDNGVIGWSSNKKGKLQKFMTKLKVAHPNQLKGKEAPVALRTKENTDGSQTSFLGFVM